MLFLICSNAVRSGNARIWPNNILTRVLVVRLDQERCPRYVVRRPASEAVEAGGSHQDAEEPLGPGAGVAGQVAFAEGA